MSSHTAIKQSNIILRDVLSVERSVLRNSFQFLEEIKRQARKRLREGLVFGGFKLPEILKREIHRLLKVQYLQGLRRTNIQVRKEGPKSLDKVGELLRNLQKLLSLSPEDLRVLDNAIDTRVLSVFSQLNERLNNQLVPFINELIRSNLNPRDAIKALNEKFDLIGLSRTSSYTLENMYRTQSQMFYNAGKFASEQDPAIQEILWGYEYVTVGDDRVRPAHRAVDGVRLPKNDPFWLTWYPPNGWSCRCAVIPLFAPEPIKRPRQNIEPPDAGFDFAPTIFTTI